jgi:hypothetical protein
MHDGILWKHMTKLIIIIESWKPKITKESIDVKFKGLLEQ